METQEEKVYTRSCVRGWQGGRKEPLQLHEGREELLFVKYGAGGAASVGCGC